MVNKCRRECVTVTSAVSSAILCACSTVVNHEQSETSVLQLSLAADPRRRYVPPIPNHDLCTHLSTMMSFIKPLRDMPTTCADMWQLARGVGDHIKNVLILIKFLLLVW